MTMKEAKAIARAIGMTINATPLHEYRVNFAGASDRSAYYAGDLQDAVDTARAMRGIGLQRCTAPMFDFDFANVERIADGWRITFRDDSRAELWD